MTLSPKMNHVNCQLNIDFDSPRKYPLSTRRIPTSTC